MSIDKFTASLGKGIGPGATWHKVDFHVHMPGSPGYEYQEADAAEQLGRTLDEGRYSIAVILKHQGFPSPAELSALKAYCPGTTLVPGAEINVIVDALSKKIGKDYFFHCILAVDPSDGDYGYVLRKAREEFTYREGEYPAGFRSSVLDLGRFFREHGAILIPAHLHQSRDPSTSRSIDDLYDDDAFLGFVADAAFDALEVRQLATANFFEGASRTADGLAIPGITCVRSSDAHHHLHITERTRATWVRMELPTFAELRAALSFQHRVSLSAPSSTHGRVVGLHVVGAFVPEMWVALNEGLNAFIGSKGSGKTALLECLRFVLNTPVPSDRADSVKRHIAHILGSSGYVEALIQLPNGERLLISRRADSPDRVAIVDAGGRTTARGLQDPLPLPVSILGWHEIERIAESPDARIGLLDRIGDPTAIHQHYDGIRKKVEHARDLMPILQRESKRLNGALRDLWGLQEKRQTLQRLEQGAMLALQQQYEWYLSTEQKLEGLSKAAINSHGGVKDAVTNHLSLDAAWLGDGPLPPLVVDALRAVALTLNHHVETETLSVGVLQGALGGVVDAVRLASETVAAGFASFRDSVYSPRVDALSPQDRQILTHQIQVLEETKRLPLVEALCQGLLRSVAVLAGELREICDAILAEREAIIKARLELVASLNATLQGVQLRFMRSASRRGRQGFHSRHGDEGRALLGYVESFGNAEMYHNLRMLFHRLCELSLEQGSWRLEDALWDIRLAELFGVAEEDDIEISLEVGKAGYVSMENLSAGQRCVAVFPLLLRNSKGPLVIDQPEDNLDNRYIADLIAPDLCARKSRQQFIVTSHNANLVVLTDADLIVHMDSDGRTCVTLADGFLACPASRVRDAVLNVLDGGKAALEARQRKYGA
jgi:energy-coupling factor transporter ATP-binding protein EcfA2